ncbi:MAG: type IV-A pilus assembly ATPase PilB, partial [Pseudomonadota bacterium]|nr:type IV-A pilus assembly ATPase PilB [Pseudomonadota bacterium]
MASQAAKLSGLARKLVNDKLIDKDGAEDAAQQAADKDLPLVSYLVQNDLVSASAIANSAAQEFGTPLIDLEAVDPEAIPSQ